MRMTHADPPAAATWLLNHLTPADRNEALAGDLREEFRAGRSAGWYWRQIVAAIAIAFSRQVILNRMVLLFAVVWSVLVPSWLLAIAALEQRFNLNQRFFQMEWPWSIVCDWGLLLAANLVFIWTGVALYLIPPLWTARNLRLRLLFRGVLSSLPGIFGVWAALVILPKGFILSHAQSLATSAPASNLQFVAVVVRLPFFLTLLCALWGTAARFSNRHDQPKGSAAQ
jgi:hypothetical protein